MNNNLNKLTLEEAASYGKNIMKSCYIYVRVSTEEQAKYGYSIEAQKKTCAEYAKRIDYTVLDIFADEGETATAADRPGFQAMLNKCEETPPNSIVVWQTDRFARNEVDHFMVKEKLNKLGVNVLSVAQPMLDESPEGRLLDTVLAGVNAFYSRDLGRKTKKGLKQKWDEGWWPGWAPLGYTNTKNEAGKGIVIIDEQKGSIVKEGLKLFSTGNYTIAALLQWFHERGLRSQTNKVLQFSVIHGILRNPFYYRLMKWNGLEKLGNHKALIDKATYDLNQYILAKHRGFLIRQRKHDFLLRSFVICADCGQRYTAEYHYNTKKLAKRGGKIAYYHCAKRGGCKSPYIEQVKMETLVERQMAKMQFSEEFVRLVTEKAKEVFGKQKGDIDDQKRAILNQKMAVETKRNILEDRLLDGTLDREAFKRKHLELEAQINAFDTRILELEQKRQIDVDFIGEILAFTRNIHQTYLEAPHFLKRHYLRFFFDNFLVKDKKIVKTNPSPLFLALQRENQVILLGILLPGRDSNARPYSYRNPLVTKRTGLSHSHSVLNFEGSGI